MATAADPAGAAPEEARGGYQLRPAGPQDAEELGRLHCAVWRATYRRQLDPEAWAALTPEPFVASWRSRLAGPPAPGTSTLVAHSGGRMAGFGVAGPPLDEDPPAPTELHALDLLPAHHGTGLADSLLTALLGIDAAYLWVVAGNDRAVAFAWRHGFRPDAVERLHQSGVRQVRMVRPVQTASARR